MSWDTYQEAIDLMEQNEEECDFVGERTDELINKAENALGFRFSKIYRDFVKNTVQEVLVHKKSMVL